MLHRTKFSDHVTYGVVWKKMTIFKINILDEMPGQKERRLSILYINVVFVPTSFRMWNIPNNSDPKQAPCQE